MFSEAPSRRRRIVRASLVLVANLLAWVVLPYYLGTLVAGLGTSTPLAVPEFVYEFGILITILQVGAALAEGHFLWVPLVSGSSVVAAVYIWIITGGGTMTVGTGVATVSLEFRVILYLILLPIVWSAVRAPASYVLYRRGERRTTLEPAASP